MDGGTGRPRTAALLARLGKEAARALLRPRRRNEVLRTDDDRLKLDEKPEPDQGRMTARADREETSNEAESILRSGRYSDSRRPSARFFRSLERWASRAARTICGTFASDRNSEHPNVQRVLGTVLGRLHTLHRRESPVRNRRPSGLSKLQDQDLGGRPDQNPPLHFLGRLSFRESPIFSFPAILRGKAS